MTFAELALNTILQKPIQGIATSLVFLMEHRWIERLAGVDPAMYVEDPQQVYLAMQRAVGTCMIDQWIPENPLTMGQHGYQRDAHSATEGTNRVILDGIEIDSAESVVDHLERSAFPCLQRRVEAFDEGKYVSDMLRAHEQIQGLFGSSMLKVPYGEVMFPGFGYGMYGYEAYFSGYALYPEVMERHFSLQADLALRVNQAVAQAYVAGNLPPLHRLDHDMADSRGTLVDVRSLDRLWFPHFARCLKPLLDADVRLVWHCDGNLMQMVPRFIDVGIRGFQGFQYESGMDYEQICRMKSRDGDDLIIIAGVSVTTTLPYGNPHDVKRQLDWLVENGPRTGLFLGCSSSVTPGVPWANIQALVEGLQYYRERRRA